MVQYRGPASPSGLALHAQEYTQTFGSGICVAKRPESMYKLELIQVIQSKAIRNGMNIEIKNIQFCEVIPPNTDFKLLKIEHNHLAKAR